MLVELRHRPRDRRRAHRRARRGLTAITGETGRARRSWWRRSSSSSGAADAALVRNGAPRRASRAGSRTPTGEEIVLARVVPADGRSRAYIDGRLATVAELAELGARSSTSTVSTPTSRLLARRAARRARPVRRDAGARAWPTTARRRAAPRSRVDAELAALGGDERARAARSTCCVPDRGDRGAGIVDAGEDVALEAEEALLADAAAHREALTAVRGGRRRRRSTRSAPRSALADRRASRAATSGAGLAGRARRARARAAARGRGRSRRPAALEEVGRGVAGCCAS